MVIFMMTTLTNFLIERLKINKNIELTNNYNKEILDQEISSYENFVSMITNYLKVQDKDISNLVTKKLHSQKPYHQGIRITKGKAFNFYNKEKKLYCQLRLANSFKDNFYLQLIYFDNIYLTSTNGYIFGYDMTLKHDIDFIEKNTNFLDWLNNLKKNTQPKLNKDINELLKLFNLL